MPIDTLKAARRLQEDDTFSPDQAERIAEVLSEMDVASATKEDLDDVYSSLNEQIEDVRSSLKEDIEDVRSSVKADLNDVETRLDNRIDRGEEKLRNLIDRRHQELKTFVMTRVGWAAGLLAVWIALLNYLLG